MQWWVSLFPPLNITSLVVCELQAIFKSSQSMRGHFVTFIQSGMHLINRLWSPQLRGVTSANLVSVKRWFARNWQRKQMIEMKWNEIYYLLFQL